MSSQYTHPLVYAFEDAQIDEQIKADADDDLSTILDYPRHIRRLRLR